MLPSQRLHVRKYTTFLLLHVICDFTFQMLLFAVVKFLTGCKYNLHDFHRVLLHRKIPGSCISRIDLALKQPPNLTSLSTKATFTSTADPKQLDIQDPGIFLCNKTRCKLCKLYLQPVKTS